MKQAYKVLLSFYPKDYVSLFGTEMLAVFEEAAEERRGQPWAVLVSFILAEFFGLLIGIGTEWMNKVSHSGSYLADHCLPGKAVHATGEFGTNADPGESEEPGEVIEAKRHLELILSSMEHAIASHQFQKARLFSIAELEARENLRRLRTKYKVDDGR